jgi:hypothetical protein
MNVATGNRVTAQDLVRVEKLLTQVNTLQSAALAVHDSLHHLSSDRLESAKRCISTGAKVFAKEEDTRVQELEREIALLRARMQCELWEGWWTEVEQELAKLNAAFVEFRATQSLASVLDCCSD